MLPRGKKMARGHVVAHICDANGNVVGRVHINPILDNRTYQVEFTGGEVTESTANVIAELMYALWNADKNGYLLSDMSNDYCKDNNAIFLAEQQTSIQGRPVTGKTTVGWQICCQWKYGSTSWEKLYKLKDSHPV